MTATAAVTGFGTIFAYESASDTFTALGEIINVDPPKKTRDAVEATHMGSDDGYHEYIPGMKDGGEFNISFNYTEAGATLAQTIFEAGKEKFKITLPGSSTVIFDAIPTGEGLDTIEVGDKIVGTLTGKVTGKPTFLAV